MSGGKPLFLTCSSFITKNLLEFFEYDTTVNHCHRRSRDTAAYRRFFASIVRVFGPASFLMSFVEPTATIRFP